MFSIPDGAAEQDGVLQYDGQARPEGLQRQFGDVNVIDDNPPCERKSAVITQNKAVCCWCCMSLQNINSLQSAEIDVLMFYCTLKHIHHAEESQGER